MQETIRHFPYLILIPLFPLLGALYNGLLGARLYRKKGEKVVHLPSIILPVLSFFVALTAFLRLAAAGEEVKALYYNAWSWVKIGSLRADMAFWFDHLSAVMALVVTFVGSLIHIYSVGYMRKDPGYWRFFAYLNLFMFSMLMLVLGDNFLLMFIGWEGVGLCSYLLISFWYRDPNNAAAGMKAFIVNRVGDFGFIIGIFLLFWGLSYTLADFRPVAAGLNGSGAGGTIIFRELESALSSPTVRDIMMGQTVFGVPLITLACIFLFVGAMGKSAQIPLYVWLPDAMAGPTPVSALIHAATMVTAGVYMVARLHFLYVLSPFAMTWVALFGAVTALYAATIGFFQYDIKKVLAYSTISQLGYMFIGVGVGAYSAGIFHLMTHAFFKGCLFLAAGSVIIGCHHNQDMREMGGLKEYMPITHWAYLMACLAISGIPLFSGFFSKDEILFRAFISEDMLLPGAGKFIWFIGALGALCTAFYMFRSYYMTFTGKYRGDSSHKPHESPHSMTYVLLVLGTLSIIGGFIGMPHVFHLGNLFEHWMEPVFSSSESILREMEYTDSLEWSLMGLSIVLALVGLLSARWLYRKAENPLPQRMLESRNPLIRGVYQLVYNKYYIDELYQATIVAGVMKLRLMMDWIDRNIIDWMVNFAGFLGRLVSRIAGAADLKGVDGMVNGTAYSVRMSGLAMNLLQTGRLRNYLGIALGGAVILILLNYFIY